MEILAINEYLPEIKLENREKTFADSIHGNMKKFTANYVYSNSNFVIQNATGNYDKSNKFFPIICILKNILMRGCPTFMSEYLSNELGFSRIHDKYGNMILDRREFGTGRYLISKETPHFINTIKGYSDTNDYPAVLFYEEIIPEYLGEYSFIQKLIVPEATFAEVTGDYNNELGKQQVDFYLPQAKLVIEIDGLQHEAEKASDDERDEFLRKHDIDVVRISAQAIKARGVDLRLKVTAIEQRLKLYDNELDYYKEALDTGKEFIVSDKYDRATAVIRFQMAILELIAQGILDLNDDTWRINVIERDVNDFEKIAMTDLFLWIKHLSKLNKIPFRAPEIIWNFTADENDVKIGMLNIDFSLFRRYTDENEFGIGKDKVWIRTDYFDRNNYFKVSTGKYINYEFIREGEDSDDASLDFMLKNLFGYCGFQEGQKAGIINSLEGRDTISLLPTGAGKSLIYQFVALLEPTICFVVEPLVSLMKDQKDNLDAKGIDNTDVISSMQTTDGRSKALYGFGDGRYKFVWISPERFQIQGFRNQLESISECIGLAVIDEIHCLSEWGHDFRTSYLNLAKTIRKCACNARILGLTATAGFFTLKDIMNEFDIKNVDVKTLLYFSRENLHFRIRNDYGERYEKLTELLDKMNEKNDVFKLKGEETQAGIVFTRFVTGKQGCYNLCKDLQKDYPLNKIEWYAASSPTIWKKNNVKESIFNQKTLLEHKERVHDAFKANELSLLVATKAFGMGIDKPNVRYTIHYGTPVSSESLYQEAGRAGRDNENAGCYILYAYDEEVEKNKDKLFSVNATVHDINEVLDENRYAQGDVLKNLSFWLKNNEDLTAERELMLKFCTEYWKDREHRRTIKISDPKYSYLVKAGENEIEKKVDIQKIIYKLSLLGVVNDWTLEYKGLNKKYIIEFNKFDKIAVEQSMVNYIKKYDETEAKKLADINLHNKDNKDFLNDVIEKLLTWQYENISFNRKKEMQTVYENCKECQDDPEEFKKRIEKYFSISEGWLLYDHIVEHQGDYSKWFGVFYDSHDKFIGAVNVSDNHMILRRFLESIRNNVGLNLISGMDCLLTDDYENLDGRERLEYAFKSFDRFSKLEITEILNQIYKLSLHMNQRNKEYLSQSLISYFPDRAYEIYDGIGDNYSLEFILCNAIARIRKNGEKIWMQQN